MPNESAYPPFGTTGSTACAAEFWPRFAAEHWERASGAFPGAFPAPPISPQMAFEAAICLSDAARAGRAITDPCIWLDGQKLDDPVPYLPQADDRSFAAYGARLRQETGAREYTALFPELHCYGADLFQVVRRILRDVTGACGLPSGWSDTALFVGEYERTPFGIHDGPMSVLTVPVIGRKTFRLWNEEEIAQHPELVGVTRYDPEGSQSKLLTAAPGDLIYWPSREWHIAEADIGLTAALSFGFWTSPRECHPLRQVGNIAERLLAAQPVPSEQALVGMPTGVDGGGKNTELPAGWTHYLQALRGLVGSGDLETELMGEYLRQSSCFGLKELPAPVAAPVDRHAPVVSDPLAGLCFCCRGDQLLVAASGQVFTLPHEAPLLNLLSALQKRPVAGGDITEWCAADRCGLTEEDVWSVAEHLAGLGAVVSTPGQRP